MTLSSSLPAEPLYFARPSSQYRLYKDEIDAAIQRVLDGHVYIMGEEVRRFEAEFAAWAGAGHAIGVANGTDALHLSLRALGIGTGDEVITTAHTAVATIAAIEMCGARPRFADIQPDGYGLDPESVAGAIRPATKAILPVHIYGHPVDLGPLAALADRHGLILIEDCAQAHGATWNRRRVGTVGRVGCFSLYPTKNLGAIGDGGIVITDDGELADRLRLLRQYGWRSGQVSEIPGWNSRLDELQAAILRVKLRHLDDMNARRRAIAGRYIDGLGDLGLDLPHARPGCEPVYHLFVIRVRERDRLKQHLAEHQIIAGIHYPLPAHQHPAYIERLGSEPLPVTESVCSQILSLPMYPELTDAQVDRVIAAVRTFQPQRAAAE